MIDQRVATLERQMGALRREVRAHGEWLDTICSPLWKRLWWWCCGFRFYRVGRWR